MIKNLNKETFNKAIKSLKKQFGLDVSFKNGNFVEIKSSTRNKKFTKKYRAEISKANLSSLGQIALHQKGSKEKIILISDYIPPKTAEKLREFDIAFFDANGNAYFNEPEFYIFVSSKGNKLKAKTSNPNLIFQKGGLQILFLLLSIPGSENKTYRELAEMSGVSLGTVSEVMNALQTEKYLVKKESERKLFRKSELLKRWVQDYSEKILPKLHVKEFSASEENWWKNVDLSQTNACWGGEVAASLLTENLIPTGVKIFAKGTPNDLIKKYRLRKQDEGKVKIVEKFWNFDESNSIAPPLLVYADLLATAKARNIETAQIIYDQYLAGLIE